jgi:SAM-dependent methyltransferase
VPVHSLFSKICPEEYNKQYQIRKGRHILDKLPQEQCVMHQDSVSFSSYEELADHYFKDVDTKPWNAWYERPATISLLPEVKGKKVLDAACAAGWYTQWLLDHGANVTALDFSPRMIEMTRKRVGDKADLKIADLNQPLNFIQDESVDVVLSSLTLHYLKNWGPVMAEFNRILKNTGCLVFSVHHPFMDFTLFKRDNYFLTELLDDEWCTNKGKVKVQFFRRPLNQIITPVIDAGFVIEKLLEPMPAARFKIALPESYEKLTKNPWFLFIRAGKGSLLRAFNRNFL